MNRKPNLTLILLGVGCILTGAYMLFACNPEVDPKTLANAVAGSPCEQKAAQERLLRDRNPITRSELTIIEARCATHTNQYYDQQEVLKLQYPLSDADIEKYVPAEKKALLIPAHEAQLKQYGYTTDKE